MGFESVRVPRLPPLYFCNTLVRYSEGSDGFIRLLRPTAELWTLTLPHRTQVIYHADISLVILLLELSPGKTVAGHSPAALLTFPAFFPSVVKSAAESGTGSGSLTHSLIRSVAPTGHVYTFEFHENRCLLARAEFERHVRSPRLRFSPRRAFAHIFYFLMV